MEDKALRERFEWQEKLQFERGQADRPAFAKQTQQGTKVVEPSPLQHHKGYWTRIFGKVPQDREVAFREFDNALNETSQVHEDGNTQQQTPRAWMGLKASRQTPAS